MLEDIID